MNVTAKTNGKNVKKIVKKSLMKRVHEKAIKIKDPPTMIHEVVVERKKRVGVIAAWKDGDVIRVGFSKCNFKAGDRFFKAIGLGIAEDRAFKKKKSPALPLCMGSQMNRFYDRAIRYFKDAKSLDIVR